MVSKHQDSYLKKYDEKSLDKIQSKVIFSDPAYLFIFKKTEKIIAALYLITNLISDTEPIKLQIRKLSIGLMSDVLSLKKTTVVQSRQTLINLMSSMSETISLLKIASTADHISSMNYSIIQKELVLLMDNLQNIHEEITANGSSVFPQDFFNVATPIGNSINNSGISSQVSSVSSPSNYPLAKLFPTKGHYRTSESVKDKQTQQVQKDNIKDIKNSRHDNIIRLLNDGKTLGIKDFAREIKDCSEKTIQRELISLVATGVLKKTGERRWSLYSLV